MKDSFDKFLDATRRTLSTNIAPVLYEDHIKLALISAHTAGIELDIRLCYTSERRSEAVRHGNKNVIFIDQYLGQTLSNLARIVHESTSTAFALNYTAKMFAEHLQAHGKPREAFVCARVHSEDGSKLRHLPKRGRRGASIFFQERFLVLHETYHFILKEKPLLRHSVSEVIEDYFSYLRSSRAENLEIFGDDDPVLLDMLAADPDKLSIGTINEMVCDFFAFSVCVNSVSHDSKVLGRDGKYLAAIGCLEALKSSQIINVVRDTARYYSHKKMDDPEPNLQAVMQDYQVRSRFMNWLCNTEPRGVMRSNQSLVDDIDSYLENYHDKLGVVAFTICEAILNGKFEDIFSADAEFVDSLLSSGEVRLENSSEIIDAMTNWLPQERHVIESFKKDGSESSAKYIKRLRQLLKM
jgi:hypothetical protein